MTWCYVGGLVEWSGVEGYPSKQADSKTTNTLRFKNHAYANTLQILGG